MKTRIVFLFIVQIFYGEFAIANHVLGGHITWTCEANAQYNIVFTLYKDCYGSSNDPTSEILQFFPEGCVNAFPESVDLAFISSTEISDLCPDELSNSSCVGGFLPGTSKVVYGGTVTLASGCLWKIFWNNGDWNYFVNMNFTTQDAFISAIIDTNQPCENSPEINSELNNTQVPYICLNMPYSHELPIQNDLGQTLSYAVVNSETSGVNFGESTTASGYVVPSGLTLTGNVLNWTATSLGNFSVCVEITIYDGASYIGTILENMCFVVRNCPGNTTGFSYPEANAVGTETIQVDHNIIRVCAGDSLEFSVQADNTNALRSITLDYEAISGLPLTFSQSGSNPVAGSFGLRITNSMIAGSPYILNIHASDDGCPNAGTDDISVTLQISPQVVFISVDTTVCPGQSVILNAHDMINSTWTILPGGSNEPSLVNNVNSQNISPEVTTSYVVSSPDVLTGCASADTMVVHVALSEIILHPMNATCGNDDGSITIELIGDGSGDYSYDWTGLNVIDDLMQQTGLVGGIGQNYSVVVTDNYFGCIALSATNVSSEVCSDQSDAGTMSAIPLNICDLLPAYATWNNNGFLDSNDEQMFVLHTAAGTSIGNIIAIDCDDSVFGDEDSPLIWGPTSAPGVIQSNSTYYISSVVGDGNSIDGCVDLNQESFVVSMGEAVTWHAPLYGFITRIDNDTLCEGELAEFLIEAGSPGILNVEYTINGEIQDEVQGINFEAPAILSSGNAGTICLVSGYNTLDNCPAIFGDCVEVPRYELPSASMSASFEICEGDTHCFEISVTGQIPASVLLQDNQNNIDEITFSTVNAEFYCTSDEGEYQIISVFDDHGCVNNTLGELVSLTVNPLPSCDWSVTTDTSFCEGSCVDLEIVSTGVGPFNVNIVSADPTITTEALQQIGNFHAVSLCEPGLYHFVSVEDAHGCMSERTDSLTLTENPLPIVDFVLADPVVYDNSGASIEFIANASNTQEYLWDLGDGFTETNASFVHLYSEDFLAGITELEVSLLVTSAEGCANEISHTANVIASSVLNAERVQVHIFPNPAKDVLQIQSLSGMTQCELIDVRGKLILLEKFVNTNSTRIDVSSLPSGVYVLKVQGGLIHHIERIAIDNK